MHTDVRLLDRMPAPGDPVLRAPDTGAPCASAVDPGWGTGYPDSNAGCLPGVRNAAVRMLDRLPTKDDRGAAVDGALFTAFHTCGAGGVREA